MLHLASRTAASWLALAAADPRALLVDHAQCEKKAAATAVGLLFRYADHVELMAPLSRLAREELEHYELVLDILRRRGIADGPEEATPYAARLREVVRPREPQRLLDVLLCAALIEARSCERMQILADGLPDEELRAFYAGLLASEARHHATYVDLALAIAPREEVLGRLDEVARHEAHVLAEAPLGPRLHE
jgi:tRNA-(ms[2]io[6]A)-hydroxylase